MNKLQQIASKVTDPASKWETRRQYPTGSAQQEVLNALGLTANNHGHATAIFAELGIVVGSRREGRKSVPVVTKSEIGGGFNFGGDGDDGYTPSDGLDLSAISQWIS
jgi:hypothetical protein